MDIRQIQGAVQAILFASGEPVPLERISQALEVDKATVQKIILNLSQDLEAAPGGLRILHLDNSFQMVAREEYAPYVRKVLDLRRNTPLSPAAMEVLAIVAYNQPVTRGYIEQVRGVDCSGSIGSLVSRGLIAECGRMDVPGKPILYGTTLDFLKCFDFASLRDLPPLPEEPADGEEPQQA